MVRIGSGGSPRSRFHNVQTTLVRFALVTVFGYIAFIMNSFSHLREIKHVHLQKKVSPMVAMKEHAAASSAHDNDTSGSDSPRCSFRNYPKRRYYGLQEAAQPDFLANAEYIYGQLPSLLRTAVDDTPRKLCVNQTEWHSSSNNDHRLLLTPFFADGTNPSILALKRVSRFPHHVAGAKYLATICMTNSQCSWKDTQEEKRLYHISSLGKPSTVRTVLLWLDENMDTLEEATIVLERDAPWGRRNPPIQEKNGSYRKEPKPLDDARLFYHNKTVWVSYRDGPSFGYESQVLNPLHVFRDGSIVIRASESVPFSGGRNMALMENDDKGGQQASLHSLTWVDPVTVRNVNVGGDGVAVPHSQRRRRRRLAQSQRKSHFHGTNGFLVPYGDEWLGIGHFHRPPGRDPNDYARHGHHYTHAFFTISGIAPFQLKRLSREFVIPSEAFPQDAEIIQFASGLELDDANGKVLLAYGINDCEGAIVNVDVSIVEEMLRPVKDGQEVLDLMRILDS
jgi:hypothetical protein